MNTSFQSRLTLQVREVVGRNSTPPPLLVWCTPDRSWLDLLHEAAKADGLELWAPASEHEETHELSIRHRFDSSPRAASLVSLQCRRDSISWFNTEERDDGIRELTDFDARLEAVSREGNAMPGLKKLIQDGLLERWCSVDGKRSHSKTMADLIAQGSAYAPGINDGVCVNIAPLQKAGILAADVLAAKDIDKAIADRAKWRADERRWVREGKLPQPGWWTDD